MTSVSPRVGFILPSDNDVVDVSILNDTASRMDSIANVTQSTSVTRPSPFIGQTIFDTDTKEFSRSDGPSNPLWKTMRGKYTARGYVASSTNTGTPSVVGAAATPYVSLGSLTFSALANRRYKFIAQGWFQPMGTQSVATKVPVDLYMTYNAISAAANPVSVALPGSCRREWIDQSNWAGNFRVPYYLIWCPNLLGQPAQTLNIVMNMNVDTSKFQNTASIGVKGPVTGSKPSIFCYDLGDYSQ